MTRPSRLVVLLAAVTLVPMGVLGWLTVRMLAQDRDVERQRQVDALEVEANRVALGVERRLQAIEAGLAQGDGIRMSADGLAGTSEAPVLFQAESTFLDVRDPALAAAEAHEQRGRLDDAVRAYRALAGSAQQDVRAGALLGLGRTLKKAGRPKDALDAYARLELLNSMPAAGVPASLIACYARGRLFEESADHAALLRAGQELAGKLASGAWRIDRATFESYSEAATRWGGPPANPDAMTRTTAAVSLWREWRAGSLSPAGRKVIDTPGSAAVAVWTTSAKSPVARVLTSRELEAWIQADVQSRAVKVAAFAVDGRPLFGTAGSSGISLLPQATRLPFILNVSPLKATGANSDRRAVFVGGVALTCALMLAAAYALHRTTTREVKLARQQADFVSAVSHEFRTPLTSMRHIMDLLSNRRVTDEERRRHYYSLLTDETERLHRMVESLLSFGRIEAGGYSWQLERVDIAGVIDRTVGEFRREPVARGRQIQVTVETDVPSVSADREALSRALWNLLENAAKYSIPGAPISVFARTASGSVEFGVRDQGEGINPGEHDRIFQKFVRGTGATESGARGVGIGLALVKMIVTAHRGSISVDSAPGKGSTFTIVLPAT